MKKHEQISPSLLWMGKVPEEVVIFLVILFRAIYTQLKHSSPRPSEKGSREARGEQSGGNANIGQIRKINMNSDGTSILREKNKLWQDFHKSGFRFRNKI